MMASRKFTRNQIWSDSLLSPRGEPRGQTLRQICRQDTILRAFQVVGCATESDDTRIGIEQRESRTPIAVTRLSYRTRIDQVTHTFLQLKIGGLTLSHAFVHRTVIVSRGMIGREPSL